jgi:hypothetical protein
LFGLFKELKRPEKLEKPDKLKMGYLGLSSLLGYFSVAVLGFIGLIEVIGFVLFLSI